MKNIYTLLSIFTLSAGAANAQITWSKYINGSSAPIGTYQGHAFRESGFSGLCYIPGTENEFFTISDRGPNIDAGSANCASGDEKIFPFPAYVPKIHRIKITDSIRILYTKTVKRPDGTGMTGLPNPNGAGNAREIAWSDTSNTCPNTKTLGTDAWGIDPEGIQIGANNTFWVCEEYGTTIQQLDSNGKVINRYSPFGNAASQVGIDTVLRYRTPNRGFEGVAVTPNGKVYGIVQSTMEFPKASVRDTTRILRLVEIDPATNTTRQFAYIIDSAKGTGGNKIRFKDIKIGDMVAINNNEFLLIEHAVRGTTDRKKIYRIDISGATPITTNWVGGKTIEQYYDSTGLAGIGITAVKKWEFMDLLANGWEPVLDKPEDMAIVNDSTLVIGQDNDFGNTSVPANGIILPTNLASTMYVYKLAGSNKISGYVKSPYIWPLSNTGITSVDTPAMKIYPNPVQRGTNLQFSQPVSGMVYDMTGRVVLSMQNAGHINTANLTNGIYIIKTSNGSISRFVVE